MRVHLAALTFDPLGAVTLDVRPESAGFERRRRINRVATLDGGAAFNDNGYTDVDVTIRLVWTPRNRATEAAVERLLRLYSFATLAMPGGLYRVALEAYTPTPTESTLSLLVAARLAPAG
jgi:hypothetical protein